MYVVTTYRYAAELASRQDFRALPIPLDAGGLEGWVAERCAGAGMPQVHGVGERHGQEVWRAPVHQVQTYSHIHFK